MPPLLPGTANAVLHVLQTSGWLQRQAESEWQQDIPQQDITGLLIPETAMSAAYIETRQACVLCGRPWLEALNVQISNHLGCEPAKLEWCYTDGDWLASGDRFVYLTGNSRLLLAIERSMLNFLQTLCATATISKQAMGWQLGSCQILGTRKTLPGMRLAQKYALCVGGCGAHRLGLSDAFLIKENHLAAVGGIKQAVALARRVDRHVLLQIEVETMSQLETALLSEVDRILLDNFNQLQIKKAVARKRQLAPTKQLEVSGVPFMQAIIEDIAATGVEYISVGALTKHCNAIDLSMRFVH